jgi:hypothetical protein
MTFGALSAGLHGEVKDAPPVKSDLPEPTTDTQKFGYVKRHVRLLQAFMVCSCLAVAHARV